MKVERNNFIISTDGSTAPKNEAAETEVATMNIGDKVQEEKTPSIASTNLRRGSHLVAGKDQHVFAKLLLEELNGLSADQMQKLHKKSHTQFIIPYNSTARKYFDVMMTFITFYEVLVIPTRIAFANFANGVSLGLEIGFDTLFVVATLINFRTSYIDSATKENIKDVSEIVSHYVRGWLTLDIMSSLPLTMIYNTPKINPSSMFIQFLHLLKAIQIFKVSSYPFFQSISISIARHMNPALLRMTKLALVFLLTQHWIACFYWFVSRYQHFSTTWCPASYLQESHWSHQYAISLHWAFIATTSNDLHPVSELEALFTCFMLFIGIAINASIIGSAANLLGNMDKRAVAFRAHLDAVNDFLRFKKVPDQMQIKIRDYYEYLWTSGQSLTDVETLFRDLPSKIKLQLLLDLKRNFINKVPLFKACSTAGIVGVVQSLDPVIAVPGDIIIREGELGNDFFFIDRGSVGVSLTMDNKFIELGNLGEGSFFGEIALLRKSKIRMATVEAHSFCELEKLNRDDFLATMLNFPQLHQAISQLCESRIQTANNMRKMKRFGKKCNSKVNLHQGNNTNVVPMTVIAKTLSLARNKIRGRVLAEHNLDEEMKKESTIYDTIVDDKFLSKMSHANAKYVANAKGISTMKLDFQN